MSVTWVSYHWFSWWHVILLPIHKSKQWLYICEKRRRIRFLTNTQWVLHTWAPSQYPKRRLFVRSRKVSKPRDWYFKLSYRFEIWQAHRQHCCRSACQISERSDNSKYKSRGFETLRDLTERRLFGYWDGAQESIVSMQATVPYVYGSVVCSSPHLQMSELLRKLYYQQT